jgi:hypothetical protein
LKKTFWNEAYPAANDLVEDERKEYFGGENTFIELNPNDQTIVGNEPRGKGKDFKFYDVPIQSQEALESDIEVEEDEPVENFEGRIKNTFKDPAKSKNLFGMDLDADSETEQEEFVDTEENCINVTSVGKKFEIETDDIDGNFQKCFKAILRTETDFLRNFSKDDLLETLKDDDTACDASFLQKLAPDFQQFLTKFPYFRDEFMQEQEGMHASLLNVPSIEGMSGDTSSELNVLTDSSNVRYSLRAKPSMSLDEIQAKRAAALGQSRSFNSPSRRVSAMSSPSRFTRSKKENLVSEPSVNPKMDKWMKDFKGSKRARSSLSPS